MLAKKEKYEILKSELESNQGSQIKHEKDNSDEEHFIPLKDHKNLKNKL